MGNIIYEVPKNKQKIYRRRGEFKCFIYRFSIKILYRTCRMEKEKKNLLTHFYRKTQ